MASDLAGFVRDAVAAVLSLDGFEARQSITAHDLHLEAVIRVGRQGRITVQYEAVHDPISAIEDELTGAPEFVDEDFPTLSLTYDGKHTWVHDRKRDVVVRRMGRALFSPIRGETTLGELGFLRTLTHDYLLCDRGEIAVGGSPARVVGLRPKQRIRSTLLKDEFFPVRSASIAFDLATLFPVRMEVRPTGDSPLSLLVPPSEPIKIEFANLKLEAPPDERFEFAPAEDARLFIEDAVAVPDLAERLPFSFAPSPIEAAGFVLLSDPVVALDEPNGRAYMRARFERQEPPDGGPRSSLTVRTGNYLSPNMSRRRAHLAERGIPADLPADRSHLLERSRPSTEGERPQWTPSFTELSWEAGGLFWFLLGEEVAADELIAIAAALIDEGPSPTPRASSDRDPA